MITSSILSYVSMPTISPYCATKAMVSNFAESLHFEVKEWIDVTNWEPGGVSTTIFNNGIDGGQNPPPKWTMLSAQRAVSGVLS